jgi:uncharacterized protein YecT (DUF1311 family)
MDDQIRRYEEDRLRREKLAYFQAARNSRESREQAQATQQTVELGGLIALGLVGAVGGVLWGLFGTKIGRVITLLLLLAGGSLFALYWLQNDAVVRAQAQQSKQPQNITRSSADVSSDTESVGQPAQQLAAANTVSDAAASAATSVAAANPFASETAVIPPTLSASSGVASAAPVPSLAVNAPSNGAAVTSDVSTVAAESPTLPVAAPIEASFPCSKASTDSERLICSSVETATADKELAAAYAQARSDTASPAALKATQRAWITEYRDTCKDTACLLRVMAARTKELSAI